MDALHHVFLIPGFFGFTNFGRVVYFGHVTELLEDALARQGIRAEIRRDRPSPTASLRTRARQLFDYVRATVPPGDDPIHFVGHSTGGLDARLLVTPDVALGTDTPVEPYAQRVRTVIGVATPHHGTPIASFFSSLLGQQLLKLLSVATVAVLREGKLPLWLLARIGAVLARIPFSGPDVSAALEHLAREALGLVVAADPQEELFAKFFRDISDDQSLIPQLAPEALDLFNASTSDRDGVRYGCVVARARPPTLAENLSLGLRPSAQLAYLLYRWLHHQAGALPERHRPSLTDAQRARLEEGLGDVPRIEDNDGIIPSLSQVWGEVLCAYRADHLDVIGHFDDPEQAPPHHDWLTTGSKFDRSQFEALWSAVAQFIATGR